jgi:hypothetical protein
MISTKSIGLFPISGLTDFKLSNSPGNGLQEVSTDEKRIWDHMSDPSNKSQPGKNGHFSLFV